MDAIFQNFSNLTWQQLVMWAIGGILIFLAIKKDMEPALLLPMGFGAILVNIPMSGAITQLIDGVKEIGVLNVLFDGGIANELFPLLLFIGIGAMIDFEPLLNNPKLMLFGAAAQFGIFATLVGGSLLGFPLKDAASIAIIGAADGPTSIFVANYLHSNYLGPIIIAAYSYMALVPIVQPPIIKLLTTKKGTPHPHGILPAAAFRRQRRFSSRSSSPSSRVSSRPARVALVGFLMFGNLIRECGVLGSLSDTAQKALANLITLLLGLTVAANMKAETFVTLQTLMILGLGLVAFIFDTAGGVVFGKVYEPVREEESKTP